MSLRYGAHAVYHPDCRHHPASNGRTLEDWLAAQPFSENTRASYRAHMAAFEAAGYDPLTITPAQFTEVSQARKWSPESAHARLYCLRSYLRWLGNESAPIMRMKLKRAQLRAQRTLTLEQKIALQRACHNTPSGRQTALMLDAMWNCGLRAGEVISVLIADLDLKAGTLGTRGKGGTWAQVAVVDSLAALLEAWIREERRFMGDAVTLFVNTLTHEPLTVEGFKALCHHISVRAEIPFSPHDLRRGMAVHLTKQGIPTRVVQRQGRWSSVSMVERYTQALDIQDVRAMLQGVA